MATVDELRNMLMGLTQSVQTLAATLNAGGTGQGGVAGQGIGGGNAGAARGWQRGRELEYKHFMDIGMFQGGEDEWTEWAYVFQSAVDGSSPDAISAMQKVIEAMDEVTMVQLNDNVDLAFDVPKLGRELHNILTRKCQGEAGAIVRGVDTRDGFLAWRRLFNRYNPKTLARAMMHMVKVVTPQKVTDVKVLEQSIAEWERKVKKLEIDYDASIKPGMKMAIFTSMCPPSIQDIIYQKIDTIREYIPLRDSVLTLVKNRITMGIGGPVPMDIGKVDEQHKEHEEVEEHDIDAVKSSMQCRQCNGWGHFARECPSAKGGGKGGQKGWEPRQWGGLIGPKGYDTKDRGRGGGKGGFLGKGVHSKGNAIDVGRVVTGQMIASQQR